MFDGRLVELGPTEAVVADPLHPYTKMLLRTVEDLAPPTPSGGGYPASNHSRTYHSRSVRVQESHATIDPELREVAPGHYVACYETGQPTQDKQTTEKEEK
jgi:ABC-type oligopeptide transport system ATPase subunit